MLSYSEMQKAIIQGLEDRLRAVLPEVRLTFKNANGPHFDLVRQWLREVTIEDVDLVITIGNNSSQIAVELFNGRKYPLPTIFCAVAEEFISTFQKEIEGGAHYLTGVYAEQLPNHVPMQMVLRMYPNISKIFLPYLKFAKFGRMGYEVQRMVEYCKDRDIDVIATSIDDISDYSTLLKHINETDVTLVLEGGVTGSDTAKIDELCKQAKKPFIGDGQQAAESGGIYGFREDYHFMGAKVAEYAEQILKQGKKPHELELHKVHISVHLRAPASTTEQSTGVFISDDVLASCDGMFLDKDIATKTIAFSSPGESVFSLGMTFLLSQMLRSEKRIQYIVRPYTAFDKAQEKHQQTRLLSGVYEHLTFFDDAHAYAVWQKAKRSGLNMPPSIVISFNDNQVRPKWHHEVRAAGGVLVHVSVPAPDPLQPLRMLRESAPNIKHITAFVSANPGQLPLYLQSRFSLVRRACQKYGITLRVVGSDRPDLLPQLRRELITPDQTDACFFYHDAMNGRHASHLIDLCRERGVLMCAGGLVFGKIAPLCYGVNMTKLREYVYAYLDVFLRRKRLPENQEVTFLHDEIYAMSVNHNICKKMGVGVPKSARFPVVDISHEKQISSAMNASERPDGCFEKLAHIQKEQSEKAQKLFDNVSVKIDG